MTTTATAAELSSRPVPPMGGFSLTVLRLEIRRLLRNRRTVIFALVTPSIFFLLFGLNAAYANESAGKGNVSRAVRSSRKARRKAPPSGEGVRAEPAPDHHGRQGQQVQIHHDHRRLAPAGGRCRDRS